MYTVMISEDGMFSAEYVQPPALGIPLGISGSSVQVRRNEDLTFSAMIDGEWMMITAETMVTAANGNVYAALLSPEGVPIGVMHVAAMQDVMLGEHGGTIKLTQAEDMTWWLGETEVKDGYVHTAANGNMYVLMSEEHDGHPHWSAMYQQVMVMVALGTQGSVELVRAEDMSWWLGSAAVDVGSEVMSDNGNTYTLWYTDGVWSARFEPESMMIAGTGLTAMTREADDMYDVGDATLPESGMGDIIVDGAHYRVTKMDGMLSGVRFDLAPKGDTVFITVGLDDPNLAPDAEVRYIADDRETAFDESNTKVTIAGENISLGELLGSGSAMKAAAADEGMSGEFVESAVDVLMDLLTEAELYAKYQATAEDDAGRSAFDGRLNNIADRAQEAVDMIFGTNTPDSTAATPNNDPVASKVNIITDGTLPIEDTDATTPARELSDTDYIRATQTVRGLNRLLDALSSADAFVAATMKGNNGVFENALDEDNARKAFSANKSEFMVYLGTTANTRYGAIALKERVSAEFTPSGGTAQVEAAAVHKTRYQYDGTAETGDKVEVGRVGAFSYATANDTLRARNLLQTGGAVYTGGTIAATPAGKLYSGDMRIDVNFRQQSVFGRVSGLMDKDNNLWQYLASDVDTIYLPRQNYNNQAQFGGSGANEDARRGGTGEFKTATVVYSQSQGFSTTPTEQPTNARFAGRFIGTDGGEITGTWSLGQSRAPNSTLTPAITGTKSNDLDVIFGSYGVTRQDSSGPVGPADATAGGRVKTTAVLNGFLASGQAAVGATFAGDADTAGILRLGKRSTGGGKDTNNDFALKTIFAQPGANPKTTTNNSPTHVSVVVDHIEAQRAIYVIYAEQVGGDSDNITDLANRGRQNAWKSINDFVLKNIFNVERALPGTATDAAAVTVASVGELDNLATPLGSYFYPMTRTGRPDDDAALERIDTLLAAFADQYALADAMADDGGGVFDSQPYLDSLATAPDTTTEAGWLMDPFRRNDVFDGGDADTDYDGDESAAAMFARISSQTKLFSLSTAYTRFGVWSRRETDSAVHGWSNHATPFTEDPSTETNGRDGDGSEDDGASSPGSYAYSYLTQSTYRVDRPVATYPNNGLATYEGKTMVNMGNTQAWMGDAVIRVNWSPLNVTDPANPVATSTIVPIFSNFERWDDRSFDRLVHGGKQVDEIAFRTSADGALVLTHTDEKLGISVNDASVEVVYTDGTSIATNIADSTFIGKFVGSSGDGPLGVLGTWKVPGFRGATNAANDLTGSFGADLTSFETALP